jgi:hypothetical protein
MENKSIEKYIKNSRSKGMSDKDIKSQLKKVGWNMDEVNQAFNNLDSAPMPEPKAMPATIKKKVDEPPKPNYNDNHSNNNHNIQNDESKTNTLAIIALIMAFVFWPLGIILGIIALGKIKKSGEKGKGLAVAAIVIPIVLLGLLIIVTLIASVAYFGLLDMSQYMPERCDFPIDMPCTGKALITSNSLFVSLISNKDRAITLKDYSVEGCSGFTTFTKNGSDQTYVDAEIGKGEKFSFMVDGCDFGKIGDKVKSNVVLTYADVDTGIEYKIQASVMGAVS